MEGEKESNRRGKKPVGGKRERQKQRDRERQRKGGERRGGGDLSQVLSQGITDPS